MSEELFHVAFQVFNSHIACGGTKSRQSLFGCIGMPGHSSSRSRLPRPGAGDDYGRQTPCEVHPRYSRHLRDLRSVIKLALVAQANTTLKQATLVQLDFVLEGEDQTRKDL